MKNHSYFSQLKSPFKKEFYEAAYQTFKDLKKYEQSLNYLEKLKKINDSLLIAQRDTKFAELEQKYQTEKKEKEIYRLKAEKAIKEKALAKASRRQRTLGIILVITLLFLSILALFFHKIMKQKKTIESLQRDLHHNVKNQLSIISGLVEEMAEKVTDDEMYRNLMDLNNRINSINELHRQLYKNPRIAEAGMKKYVDKIARSVMETYRHPGVEIQNEVDENIRIDPAKASLLGLIVNEFVTNSLKHAFRNRDKGKISIRLIKKGKNFLLRLKDNGPGLPDDLDIRRSRTFGMDIFHLLSRQLNGKMQLSGKNGTELTIEFPGKH
ncbi:MAG: sensor histidine kinase [Chlorobi bacterium]|nr:sensor histidine kinase [Chlorobiota bacterium]